MALLLAGCAAAPPSNIDDVCSIFEERPKWYREVKDSFQKWRVPVPTMMAIIHQESSFRAKARPPRKKILGFIPGSRPSTAYGYTQALDTTWDIYCRETGNQSAVRSRFGDAVDFVGWYCDRSNKLCGISKHDPYRLYLAYHEGQRGYNRASYRGNRWLLEAADRVSSRASAYNRQLRRCRERLEAKPRKKFLGIF
jgi:hypothetical protein